MNDHETEHDEGYVGNVFGWRFSYLSLILILFLLALMFGRYWYLKSNGLYPGDLNTKDKIEEVYED